MDNEKTTKGSVSPETEAAQKAMASEESATSAFSSTPEPRSEISAATIARMMGVATTSDVKILAGKLDLMVGRVNALMTKMEKVLAAVAQVPTATDLERIDVQIGSLKTMLRESTGLTSPVKSPDKKTG